MRTIPAAAPPAPQPRPAQGGTGAAAAPGESRPPEAAPGRQGWPGRDLLTAPETAQVLHAAWSGDPAIVVPSPPGAGKTRLVTLLAAALSHRAGMRVGIAAQTRQQAIELARRAGTLGVHAVLIWSRSQPRPASGSTPPVSGNRIRFPAQGGGIMIATTARWLYCDPHTHYCDIMLIDEAWQATYADIGALGAFAGQIVCVGDPGQIAPVVTGAVSRWERDPRGPHIPAPDALRAAHEDALTVVPLLHTWRLGPATTAIVQPAFYPHLPFSSKRPPEHVAGPAGPLPEIAHRPVPAPGGPDDPLLTAACAARVRELADGHQLHTAAGARPLTPADIAVVAPHVSQAGAIRALLADMPDVLTGTANQMQGLERPAVVTLHPLAGYREPGGFSADPGRACVMLTRHRAHLTVITDPLAARADADGTTLLSRLLDTPQA
jgi:hypothetical protein